MPHESPPGSTAGSQASPAGSSLWSGGGAVLFFRASFFFWHFFFGLPAVQVCLSGNGPAIKPAKKKCQDELEEARGRRALAPPRRPSSPPGASARGLLPPWSSRPQLRPPNALGTAFMDLVRWSRFRLCRKLSKVSILVTANAYKDIHHYLHSFLFVLSSSERRGPKPFPDLGGIRPTHDGCGQPGKMTMYWD